MPVYGSIRSDLNDSDRYQYRSSKTPTTSTYDTELKQSDLIHLCFCLPFFFRMCVHARKIFSLIFLIQQFVHFLRVYFTSFVFQRKLIHLLLSHLIILDFFAVYYQAETDTLVNDRLTLSDLP